MDIKEMLIKIREKNNYTKKEVSEKTGIPYTTYIKYESGERKDVSMQALCKLADFYHVSLDYLLGREDPGGTIIMDGSTMSVSEFGKRFDTMPKEIQAPIKQIMDYFYEQEQTAETPSKIKPIDWAKPEIDNSEESAARRTGVYRGQKENLPKENPSDDILIKIKEDENA